MKITYYISFIFLSFLWSCSTPIEVDYIYPEDQIKIIKNVEYKTVPNIDNILGIWETEFNKKNDGSFAKVIKNIAKSSLDVNWLKYKHLDFDVYIPDDNLDNRPLIIFIHGGGFLYGNKDDDLPKTFCMEFARRGYVCASIDYRTMNFLTPSFVKAGYVATQDALSAFKYFNEHADDYGIDRYKIVIAGVSAGAVTALNAAFLGNDEEIVGRHEKLDEMYGVLRESDFPDVLPAAVVNISGAVFGLNILNDNIPVISIHGNNDEILPNTHGLPFDQTSKKYNNLIDKAKSYLSSTSPEIQNIINPELDEAKMFEVYGSQDIDAVLAKNDIYSEFIRIEGKYSGHSLVLSQNGTLKKDGVLIIDKISNFLYGVLK
ncbi:MAG: alpha/beta hydrolase [Saprospiraceae bacterium]